MAGPVYKLWMCKVTEAWYQLSEEEQNSIMAKSDESLKAVGGKLIIRCTPLWSAEQWMLFGVEEYPDVEAVQKHAENMFASGHFRYLEGMSMLGIKWPPE
jgi:hypothetical protein